VGQVGAGTKLLINGAAGAVGSAAVQIAVARGAEVTAVCSGANRELVSALGAGRVIDYRTQLIFGPGDAYDVVFDTQGRITPNQAAPAMVAGGRFIALVMRPIERRWGAERGEERLVGVDRVYTALNKLGVVPLLVFVVAYPITNELDTLVRVLGFAPPRLERLIPGLHDNALASFLAYFVLYDFAAYWVHRAQHRFGWWWALHSLHHSQRRVTAWTDDRNHILDDLLVNLVLAVFAQFVGVQPDDFVLILIVGRLVESFSHIGLDLGFGRLGARLLVAPRFHRLHHALADARDPHIHDHNFAAVFPVWDMLFGTARFDTRPRPTASDGTPSPPPVRRHDGGSAASSARDGSSA